MQIGSLKVEILSEGRFEMFTDGHINRSVKEAPSDSIIEGASQSAMVGINPILVINGSDKILLDPGLGWGLDFASRYNDVSNVRTNLAIFKLTPADITHVILSHLHYDHAAGSSYTNADSKTEATFPNATYYLHQQEWDYALSQVGQPPSKEHDTGYQLDEFYRLIADGHIHLLHEDATSIVDGVSLIRTGGHTPGHQIVHLQSEHESAYFPGDLLPSSSHLNHYKMQQMDVDPIQAKKKKIQLLQKAYQEQAILLFYHSKHGQSGRLIRDQDKQYVLADIPKD